MTKEIHPQRRQAKPDRPVHPTSVDEALPDRNAEIGIEGDNPVKTASDVPGSTRPTEAGKAGGGGSGDAPCA